MYALPNRVLCRLAGAGAAQPDAAAFLGAFAKGVPMSSVDDANQRLDAALLRLEAALQSRLESPGKPGADGKRAQLEQEMSAVRGEFASLKETSAAVSQRLDAAIGTIRNILAE